MKKIINTQKFTVFIYTLLLIICILLPAYKLFSGIYRGHILQESFQKGVLFHIFYFSIFFLCILIKKKNIFGLVFIGALVYLSLQGIIIPFLTVYIFFEIICFIGKVVYYSCLKKESDLYTSYFICGLSLWGAFGIILSIMGIGKINDLRIMTIILFLICYLINKTEPEYLIIKLKNFVKKDIHTVLDKLFLLALIFLPLVFMAETNVGQDIDSLWYILKPEYMLVGENSFYDYLGYSAFVHYYPKLVEFFFLPISGLGDYSFILIGNVFILIMLLITINEGILLLCKDMKKCYRIMFLLVIASIPAVSNISVTAKGDIFGCYLTFSGFLFFINFILKKKIEFFIFAIISLMLSTGTKLTYFLWAGLVIIASVLYFIYVFFKEKEKIKAEQREKKGCLIIGILSFIFILGIHYRTYLLTGYPLCPIGIELFKKIGFEGKEFTNYSKAMLETGKIYFKDVLFRIYSFFIDPSSLSHTVMCWPTAIIIIAWVRYFQLQIQKKIQRNKINFYLICTLIMQSVFTIIYIITLPQPDGNYFIFPFIIIIFISFCLSIQYFNTTQDKRQYKYITIITVCILLLNLPLGFVSSWSWKIGTKYYDFNIIKTNFESKKMNQEYFETAGYLKIADYISNNFKNKRVIVSGNEDRIDGAVETSWSAFSNNWCSSDLLGGYESFKNYVQYANIEGFMVLNDDTSDFSNYVTSLTKEFSIQNIIFDENAIFYEIEYEKSDKEQYKLHDIAEFLQGYYLDGWLETEARAIINTDDRSQVIITGYYPDEIERELFGYIIVNQQEYYPFIVQDNVFEITLDLQKNKIYELEIVSCFKFKSTNGDDRKLSFILNNIEIR